VSFEFHPDHASEANNLIAGLVPFLKDNGHAYHLKMLTPEAIQWQAKSRWSWEKMEAHSEINVELKNLLAKDDDLIFTDEPTLERSNTTSTSNKPQDPIVSVQIPSFPVEHMPPMRNEDDSVSTFHPGNTINLADEPGEDDFEEEITPKSGPPVGILKTPRSQDCDVLSRISTSDSATRISSLETEISAMDKAFRAEISKLQNQAIVQAKSQLVHGSMLTEIINLLKKSSIINEDTNTSPQPEVANPP